MGRRKIPTKQSAGISYCLMARGFSLMHKESFPMGSKLSPLLDRRGGCEQREQTGWWVKKRHCRTWTAKSSILTIITFAAAMLFMPESAFAQKLVFVVRH